MKLVRWALAAFLVASAVSVVSAQTGGITVKVVDSNGEPLPAATITISHATGYVAETAVLTDKNGEAIFPVLRAGSGYSINVNMPGFAPIQIPGIKVSIGKTINQMVQLSEAIVEQVKVIAQADVVDLEDTSQTTKFSDEFVQDLPVPGRFYQNVLTLAPGVQDSDGDGNPNVHGSRDRDFKAEVSGISNVDPLTGRRMSEVNANSIEEMEVITAGAGVEFSRAQGGFARILQKQGSNEFEGIVDFYYRSSLLDGTGAQNRDNTFDPDFNWVQPGFQVSGPILKDKLWYRLSHQWIFRDIPVATTAGVEIQTDNQEIHSDQITWQVSPRNRLAFQYQVDPRFINNFGVSGFRPADAALTWDSNVEQFQVTWNAPYSPKILIESRVAWQDFNILTTPTQSGTQNSCLGNASAALKSALCNDLDTGTLSGGHNEDVNQHSQRLTVAGSTTLFAGRVAGANMQFKFGLSVENERYTRDLERRPVLNLFVLRGDDEDENDTGGDSGARALVFGNFSVPVSSSDTARGVTWGFYAEDQIKPAQNLTITAGVRVDREEIRSDGKAPFDPEAEAALYRSLVEQRGGVGSDGSCGNHCVVSAQQAFSKYEDIFGFLNGLGEILGVDDITRQVAPVTVSSQSWRTVRTQNSISVTNTNFAPRLAVSWDPWKNGKTKFAATAGRYYNNIPLAIPLIELEPPSATVAFDAELQPGGWAVTGLSDRINPAVNVNTVDRDLKTPYTDEWTLGFEREIAPETSVKLTYINKTGRNQLQDIDINHAPGDFGRCRQATLTDQRPVERVSSQNTSPSEWQYFQQFNGGDGIMDNCQGSLDTVRVPPEGEDDDPPAVLLPAPDDSLDLYVQNPGWGDILLLGNQNNIAYEAFVVELIRRQYRSWEMQASYTWSQAFGDGEDFNQALGDDQSLIRDEEGFQAYDQRHVVKLNATSVTPWGFRVGGAITWQSGLPYSILLRNPAFDAVPTDFGTLDPGQPSRVRGIYPSGERNDQRNIPYWNVDARLSKEFNFGRNLNMQASLEIFNLLNDGTYQIFDPFSATGFQVNGNNAGLYRFGRRWQVGVRFAF